MGVVNLGVLPIVGKLPDQDAADAEVPVPRSRGWSCDERRRLRRDQVDVPTAGLEPTQRKRFAGILSSADLLRVTWEAGGRGLSGLEDQLGILPAMIGVISLEYSVKPSSEGAWRTVLRTCRPRGASQRRSTDSRSSS